MNGAATTIKTGNKNANVRMRRFCTVAMFTLADERSSIGSNVQADIDHKGLIAMPTTGAITAGKSNGPQKEAAMRRPN